MGSTKELNRAKKEYLNQYRHLQREQEDVESLLKDLLEDYASPKSPQFDAMPRSGKPHDLSDYVAKHDDLLRQLRRIKSDKWFLQTEILDKIGEMTDARERRLMVLRYLRGMTFRQIARSLCCSEDHVRHIHGSALQHFTL